MPIPPFPPTPWLWLLGGGVALIVSLIAVLVASAPQGGRSTARGRGTARSAARQS